MKNFILIVFLLVFSNLVFAAGTGDTQFRIGPKGTTSTTYLKAGDFELRKVNGTDAEFTNDGANWKSIGSGAGGSGGGDGYNNAFTSVDNPNAEDGVSLWSFSGGVFGNDLIDPLEGVQSFTYAPAAQNDYVRGPLLNVNRDTFKGRACQAQIEYIGGDENLELRILDLSGAVYKSEPLKAHTISAAESVFFLCPGATEIAGDANLAQLRVEIFNGGAIASPIIKFDKSYLGTLIGLSESVTPDAFSARISFSGAVTSENSNFIDGDCTKTGSGSYDCPLVSGVFNEVPAYSLGGSPLSRIVNISAISASSFSIRVSDNNGSLQDDDFSISLFKQGADAKQAVQVYTSIPKVSENVNELTLHTSGNSTGILTQNVTWSNGVTNPSSGLTAISVIGGVFGNEVPSCVCNLADGSADQCNYSMGESSISLLGFRTTNPSGAAVDRDIGISCQKQGSDFKLPTVQPILVNQVQNNLSGGVNVEACVVSNGGTAAIHSDSGLCDFLSSVSRTGSGTILHSFKSGHFSRAPVCSCTAVTGGDTNCTSHTSGINSIVTSSPNDSDVSIVCVGAR